MSGTHSFDVLSVLENENKRELKNWKKNQM